MENNGGSVPKAPFTQQILTSPLKIAIITLDGKFKLKFDYNAELK